MVDLPWSTFLPSSLRHAKFPKTPCAAYPSTSSSHPSEPKVTMWPTSSWLSVTNLFSLFAANVSDPFTTDLACCLQPPPKLICLRRIHAHLRISVHPVYTAEIINIKNGTRMLPEVSLDCRTDWPSSTRQISKRFHIDLVRIRRPEPGWPTPKQFCTNLCIDLEADRRNVDFQLRHFVNPSVVLFV